MEEEEEHRSSDEYKPANNARRNSANRSRRDTGALGDDRSGSGGCCGRGEN